MLSPLVRSRTHLALGALGACGAIVGALWVAGRPVRVEVVGTSMLPELEPGDRALAVRLRIRPGAMVVLADQRSPGRQIVKRALWMGRADNGRRVVWVEGDNPPASTDSRELGPIQRSAIRGRLVWRYAPPERSGSLLRRRRQNRHCAPVPHPFRG